jgi:hypothetical protein
MAVVGLGCLADNTIAMASNSRVSRTNGIIGTSAEVTRIKFRHLNNPHVRLAWNLFPTVWQIGTYLYTTLLDKSQDHHQLQYIGMAKMAERNAKDQYEARYDDTGGDVPSRDFHNDDYVEDTPPVPVIVDKTPIGDPVQPRESNNDEELGKQFPPC